MQIKIKNCRLSFANIRKPYVPKNGKGDPKFTASGICSNETMIEVTIADKKHILHHSEMGKVIARMCKDKWGKEIPAAKLFTYVYARADQQVDSRGPKINEDGDYYDGYTEDTFYFAASTKVEDAPEGILIVDQLRNKLPASSGHPVSGDYVNLIINAFAYEYEGKKGISASLEGVQYLRKGEPFGASKLDPSSFDEEEVDDTDDGEDTGKSTDDDDDLL